MKGTGCTILGIESSCDDTAAAVVRDGWLLGQVTASQLVHSEYGGVVPELASRAHERQIVPVVDAALRKAGVGLDELDGVAVTRGPGLMGSLLVGVSFAKGLCVGLGVRLVDVDHLQGHVLAHFINEKGRENRHPGFPFLCLLVSGGNSQIIRVRSYDEMDVMGQTIDDAAGETFDKCSKMMGLGYPGGPLIDRLAREGDEDAYAFSKPHVDGLDYSFSGLKTSVLYFLRDRVREDAEFVEKHKRDIAASLQKAVVDMLMEKLDKAVAETGIKRVALSGGVSANSRLRRAAEERKEHRGWDVYIPPLDYTTDNGAMIAMAGYLMYMGGEKCGLEEPAFSREPVKNMIGKRKNHGSET